MTIYRFVKIAMSAVCCIVAVTLFAQTADFCGIKNKSTQSGEVLNYKVYYTLAGAYIGAGEAQFSNTLETLNGHTVYHVKGTGKTYKSYDWFYKVRDVYESYIDTATMLPLKFIRNVSEANHHTFNQVNFDRSLGRAVSITRIHSIPACIQDVLSSIYYARNIDFSKFKLGDKIPFVMYLDDQVFNVYIKYLGKETLTTNYGTFNTIKFKPLLIEGTIFKGGEDMTVWVSDDINKLPLLIQTPILVGSIKVYLVSAQGLRKK